MPAKASAATATARRVRAKTSTAVAVSSRPARANTARQSRTRSPSNSDDDFNDSEEPDQRQPKRRKTTATGQKESVLRLREQLFSRDAAQLAKPLDTCSLPDRAHSTLYHRPLLLDASLGRDGQDSLLAWFDSVDTARSMPWRKPWVDPASLPSREELRAVLERRAYEVWISEIMLQQTRVAVVIDYWNRWMARWPTIHDLAAASPDDVLAAWRGLGYYSRATRIHEAAKHVVGHAQMRGLLPEDAKTLEAEVPGVGRYTAGAISSIVFGNAEPMVDGNVLRVLSRQLGLLGNVKSDKAVIDTLWAAADALVKDVASAATTADDDAQKPRKSNRPGRWGQALMELGSTVCTPKPNCSACPITSTCRAYQEGRALATKSAKRSPAADIEDACTLCEPVEAAEAAAAVDNAGDKDEKPEKQAKKTTSGKQATLAAFAFTREKNGKPTTSPAKPTAKENAATAEAIAEYARRFPLKVVKKPVREEETLVCAIRREEDGQYLIHRRPEKGLLAGLWEFPSRILDADEGRTAAQRKQLARAYVSDLAGGATTEVRHVAELGSVPWLFSHIKLTMHVHLFAVEQTETGTTDGHEWGAAVNGKQKKQDRRWTDKVDEESMGTGMTKCWLLVKDAAGSVDT